METQKHRRQLSLLIEQIELSWDRPEDFFVGGNMFFYFSVTQSKRNDFRGPDFFMVLDTPRGMRKSWVVWEEGGRVPDVVIELTSESTAEEDRGPKKRTYEFLRVPTYVIHDPLTNETEAYRLDATGRYVPLAPGPDGRIFEPRTGLSLGVWRGVFQGYEDTWLRWHTAEGELLETGEERAEQLAARLAEYERRFGPVE